MPGADAFARQGYTLTGWYDGQTEYLPGAAYTLEASDVTFTARWTPDGQPPTVPDPSEKTYYIVEFKGNGGMLVSGEDLQIVEHGTAAVPPQFEREGYRFKGWSASYDNITADTELSALWESERDVAGCFGFNVSTALPLVLVAAALIGIRRIR